MDSPDPKPRREMATLLPDLLHGQLCSEGLGQAHSAESHVEIRMITRMITSILVVDASNNYGIGQTEIETTLVVNFKHVSVLWLLRTVMLRYLWY